MARVIDLSQSDGDLVVIGRSIVLPSSETNSTPQPLNGAMRFNPSLGVCQFFFSGNWITLGGGDGSSGGTSGASPPWAISQVTGLSTALAGKANTVHVHAIADVTGLQAALDAKAALNGSVAISNIPGLQQEIDAKANTIHSHTVTDKLGVPVCLPASPPANYRLVFVARQAMHFPINLAGSFGKVQVAPTALYTIAINYNGSPVGSIVISTTGSFVFNLGSALDMVAGDNLSFVCPARDVTIDTISFNLAATGDPITTN